MEDSIRLWIAVAPPQLEELRTLQRISPDILVVYEPVRERPDRN